MNTADQRENDLVCRIRNAKEENKKLSEKVKRIEAKYGPEPVPMDMSKMTDSNLHAK